MKELLFSILVAVMAVGCVENTKQAQTTPIKFAVLSDVHFGRPDAQTKVDSALKVIVNENPAAIFVTGDITELCTAIEYNQAIEVFKRRVPAGVPVYFMMGNHDRTQDQTGFLFEQKTGQRPNQVAELNRCPFIMLSVEGGISVVKGDDCYSPATVEYLEEKLKLSASLYPSHPIFVFGHIPPSNTIWGTYDGVDDMSSAALLPLLKQYPQVIFFSGHTHYSIADERSIHQREFTTVNDGGSAYGCTLHDVDGDLADLLRPEGSEAVTEALIVSMDAQLNVTIKRLDTYRGKEIKKPWVIEAPHDGSKFVYTDSRQGYTPVWPQNAKIAVVRSGATAAITFDQAVCEDVVYNYHLDVVNVASGEVFASRRIFSQYWNGSDMPLELTWEVEKLALMQKYFVRIVALDSFGNKSQELKSANF